MDTLGRTVRVSVTTDQAWISLKEGYARLQIRTELNDSAAGMLGSVHVVKSYSMGPLSMSQAFDCGSGPSGPLADQGRMHIAIVSFVRPAPGDSTDVRTALIATADYTDGSSRTTALCATSGAVESWLLDHVAPRSMRRH